MTTAKIPPVHPGEVLLEEFLKPLGLSQYRLAKDISVPPRRINEIVHGTRAVSANTALRLSRYFGVSERFWLNLQAHYDLDVERDRLGDQAGAGSLLPAPAKPRRTFLSTAVGARRRHESRSSSPSSSRSTAARRTCTIGCFS